MIATEARRDCEAKSTRPNATDELAKRRSEKSRTEREEAEIGRYVLRVVAEAPAMTDAQRARLAILLGPSNTGEGRAVAA
jgi:hypothetical protein